MSTVEDFAAAQAAEYAIYRAVVPIYHDGARAFNPGDPVPASNVEEHGYLASGFVVEAGTPIPVPETPTAPTAPIGEPVVVDNTQEG